jgi:ParB-like chromosome segregation protein Spo0J
MTEYEFHPFADVFPLMEGEEFDRLVEDVRQNGLLEDIVLYEGKILDGRNRYRAFLAAGRTEHISYHVQDFDEGDDPVSYVISKNILRRHLTTDQRAAFAAELATMQRTDTLKRGPKASNDRTGKVTVAQAAAALKVSEPTVERAKRRMREDPEAHEKAKRGEKPTAAERRALKPKTWPEACRDRLTEALETHAISADQLFAASDLQTDRSHWRERFDVFMRAPKKVSQTEAHFIMNSFNHVTKELDRGETMEAIIAAARCDRLQAKGRNIVEVILRAVEGADGLSVNDVLVCVHYALTGEHSRGPFALTNTSAEEPASSVAPEAPQAHFSLNGGEPTP